MAIPFLTPSRCVLLIGDEALYIYVVTFNVARLLEAVPWQTDDFDEAVIALVRKQAKGRPILILNDMTDQHFKGGQRIPKVGPMDRANVLARKLQVAFPNYPIRGALPVKAKGVEGAEGKAKRLQSTLYLFAAVPMSEPVAKTIDAVKKSMSSIAGFYLLPVEASDMVSTLSAKLTEKGRKPGRWVVFIGQHRNGALRQVITRDGQLAMTRMTPVTDSHTDHEAWAQEVSQEFKATISYLSRFGFSPEDGTDVIVVCHPKAGEVLQQLIDLPCHFTALTAPEAARVLGMGIGVQEEPRYADPLHVAWAGRKSRFILPMKTADLERFHKPRQVATLLMFFLILGSGYMGWQFAAQTQKTLEIRGNLETQKNILRGAEADYDHEVARMAALGVDIKLVGGAIDAFDDLEKRRLKTLTFIKKIDEAVGPDMRLDALRIDYISNEPGPDEAADPAAATPRPEVEAALKLSFPSSIEPALGVREVNNLKRRLEEALPGYTVDIPKNVAGREFSEAVSGETGRTAKEIAGEEYAAELKIWGEVR